MIYHVTAELPAGGAGAGWCGGLEQGPEPRHAARPRHRPRPLPAVPGQGARPRRQDGQHPRAPGDTIYRLSITLSIYSFAI